MAGPEPSRAPHYGDLLILGVVVSSGGWVWAVSRVEALPAGVEVLIPCRLGLTPATFVCGALLIVSGILGRLKATGRLPRALKALRYRHLVPAVLAAAAVFALNYAYRGELAVGASRVVVRQPWPVAERSFSARDTGAILIIPWESTDERGRVRKTWWLEVDSPAGWLEWDSNDLRGLSAVAEKLSAASGRPVQTCSAMKLVDGRPVAGPAACIP
ncbi:MAG: hypothetical protein HY554_07255 [Elusimicrobia bacterium]|nr:hypothetical protein [Elusimicrobiota bacterium]